MAMTTDLTTLIDGYRLFCLAEGKRPTTIRWYTGKLQFFLTYLTENEMPTDVSKLTTTHLRAFLVHLKENVKADENNPMKPARDRNLSPKTIQGYARTLKAFFTWLHREGYIDSDPGKLLKIPKAPKVIIETLSDSQIKNLLAAVDQKSSNRHTFAKQFLINGGDLFTLQKILGHSSLEVVRLYVELSPEDIQAQHRQHSPIDWIKL